MASLERELYNWVVLLSSCSASGDLWGLEMAKAKLLVAAVCQKETKEGAGVKNVAMNEYSFWPRGSGEMMTG